MHGQRYLLLHPQFISLDLLEFEGIFHLSELLLCMLKSFDLAFDRLKLFNASTNVLYTEHGGSAKGTNARNQTRRLLSQY